MRLLATLAVSVAALAMTGTAIAAPKPVEESVTRVMQQYGLSSSPHISIVESTSGDGETNYVERYLAWVRMPEPGTGYLVIATDPFGNVRQVYTRFGAQIAGVPAY
jgi:hypothetical protein